MQEVGRELLLCVAWRDNLERGRPIALLEKSAANLVVSHCSLLVRSNDHRNARKGVGGTLPPLGGEGPCLRNVLIPSERMSFTGALAL